MPAWLLEVLIKWVVPIAIQFGVPYLIKQLPWLPGLLAKLPGIPDNFPQIVKDLIDAIKASKDAHKETVRMAKNVAVNRVRRPRAVA